jgi:hypothetical protein
MMSGQRTVVRQRNEARDDKELDGGRVDGRQQDGQGGEVTSSRVVDVTRKPEVIVNRSLEERRLALRCCCGRSGRARADLQLTGATLGFCRQAAHHSCRTAERFEESSVISFVFIWTLSTLSPWIWCSSFDTSPLRPFWTSNRQSTADELPQSHHGIDSPVQGHQCPRIAVALRLFVAVYTVGPNLGD